MDGQPNVFFQWQNPVLRDTIYPFRKEKLRDFLRYFYEIDLWKKYRDSGQLDQALKDKIAGLAAALEKEHQRLTAELVEAIERRSQKDKWFAAISANDPKTLRWKYTYYLDRQILALTDQYTEMVSRQNTLSRRVDWYAEEDTRREMWVERAKELDAPIAGLGADLEELRQVRSIFSQQDRLPRLNAQGEVSLGEAVRWEVLNYQKELEHLDHPELIRRIIARFDAEPERFEKWLQYMVFHFSGMRYRSAHGSWADPKYLLELLTREFASAEIQVMDEASMTQECQHAVDELQDERDNITDPEKIRAVDRLIAKLQFWNPRRALLEYRMAREIGDIQTLPDDEKVFLGRLENLRKNLQNAADAFPEWVWQEIARYTPLRLKLQEKNWEAVDAVRWKAENQRWREILDNWERKDITGWRKEHQESLELIVTRAVCNEIAEHIQHLRGLVPFAGLASKPKWYLNWQEKTKNLPVGDGQRAYLKQAPAEADFVNGASILWLDWVDREPNPWQIAHPLPGFSLLPAEVNMPKEKTTNTVEWGYHQLGDNYVRTRRKPTIHELRDKGRTDKEIEAIRDEMRASGGFVKQYLRWTHEATVVGVEEMVDGKYMLTFETGQIGVVLRRLSDLVGNRNVFVGFIPKADQEPDNLAEMLDRAKLLPE